MTPRAFATRKPDLADLRVLVVGLGRSGLAASRLAASLGARVTAADRRTEAELAGALAALRGTGVTVIAGGHPSQLARESDLVVVSPGVPWDVPLLEAARSLGVPVWGEVELASRFIEGRIIGISGSNGKSTVTSMTGTILRQAGLPGGAGGNLGTPLTELLEVDGPDAVHAVEVSSFQLESMETFRPVVAVIVNLSPDHLDRHATLEAYARAKSRLLEAQGPEDDAVLNADDPGSRGFHGAVRGRLHLFSTKAVLENGAFVRDGRLVLQTPGREEELLEARDLPVPGEHNVANALAAALGCRLVGCAPEAIAQGLRAYRALPHRLQHVATVSGVAYFDDSKATNLDATARAVASFPGGTIHLVLGGKDKGGDWEALVPLLERQARRVLLVGQAAPVIRRALQGMQGRVALEDCGTVPAAVRAGAREARPGDVVLLAPGCASFDQYRNFEERGLDFRRAVKALEDGAARA